MAATAPPPIPAVPLAQVQGRLRQVWRPGIAAHHLILGENGAGKTGLITRGIMPLAEYDRVLIIDVKGDDGMWEGYGAPIARVTPGFNGEGEGRGRNWYRLVVDPVADRDLARVRVKEALKIAQDEGHMILVVDETRAVTDRAELNLWDDLEKVLLRGRSRRVMCVMAAQATEYMAPSVRNQWAMAWVGSLKDDEVVKRALKLLGLPTPYLPIVRDVARRQWLYLDKEDGRRLMGMTAT